MQTLSSFSSHRLELAHSVVALLPHARRRGLLVPPVRLVVEKRFLNFSLSISVAALVKYQSSVAFIMRRNVDLP
jgi:hypothetical protein